MNEWQFCVIGFDGVPHFLPDATGCDQPGPIQRQDDGLSQRRSIRAARHRVGPHGYRASVSLAIDGHLHAVGSRLYGGWAAESAKAGAAKAAPTPALTLSRLTTPSRASSWRDLRALTLSRLTSSGRSLCRIVGAEPQIPFQFANPRLGLERVAARALSLDVRDFNGDFALGRCAEIIVDDGILRRVLAREAEVPDAVHRLDREPACRDLVLKQARLRSQRFWRQLLQRRDVVHDPDAAPVRGNDEVRVARMDEDVVHGDGRQIPVELRPTLSAID